MCIYIRKLLYIFFFKGCKTSDGFSGLVWSCGSLLSSLFWLDWLRVVTQLNYLLEWKNPSTINLNFGICKMLCHLLAHHWSSYSHNQWHHRLADRSRIHFDFSNWKLSWCIALFLYCKTWEIAVFNLLVRFHAGFFVRPVLWIIVSLRSSPPLSCQLPKHGAPTWMQ